MSQTTLCTCFKFDMIHFTGYRVIAEKPQIGHLPRNFPCTCRKNCIGLKSDCYLFIGLDIHAKFGEDCTMRGSCRCKNMVFV